MYRLNAQGSSDSPKSRLPVALRALRHPNFRLFFGGQLISLIGTWMQTVAQSWLVYRLTGSSLALGEISFVSQFPVFVLAPVGGAVADRMRRHRILIATQASSMMLAFALAALTLSGTVRVWHIFVLSTALGIVNAFDVPTRQSFLGEMVGRDDLINAIGLNSSMFNGARIVGPAIAGILVSWIGEGFCFLGNGASFLAVIGGLLLMRLPPPGKASRKVSAISDIAEGFRFVLHATAIRSLLLLLGMMSLTAMPFVVLMPIFAAQILHGGPRGLGLLMGASGVGALMGALALASRTSLRGLGRVVPVGAAAFGASLVAFAWSRWFWVSAAFLVPGGFAMMAQAAATNTLIQSMTPDALRGRVMAVYSMMVIGMAPFGALFAGALAERVGAPLTVTACGVCALLGAAVFAMNLPSVRKDARARILANGS